MKKILLAVLFLAGICSARKLQAQKIYTVAGNGTAGFSGDGGIATGAELNLPYGVATDALGNIYIADTYNSVIREVDIHDSISIVAGTGTAGFSGDGGQAIAAELNHPTWLYVDISGNKYITDYDNNRIRKVNTQGIISTVAGNGSPYSGDGGQATAAGVSLPGDVVLDKSGNLYIAEYYDNRIRMVNTSGIINTIVGTGAAGYSGDGGQATAAEINAASGIWVDTLSNLYIADWSNNRIRMVNTSGIINTVAGNGTTGYSGDGGQATAAELNEVSGVLLDASGNMYIVDIGNNRVRKVNSSGIITTIAGTGTAGYSGDGGQATAAEVNSPHTIAMDFYGNLFITDLNNNRVREITTGSPLAVNELLNDDYSIRIFPNPSNGKFTIQLSEVGSQSSVEIYNMLGEKIASSNSSKGGEIYSLPLGGKGWALDISSEPAGIYLYRVISENGKCIGSGKLIIQ